MPLTFLPVFSNIMCCKVHHVGVNHCPRNRRPFCPICVDHCYVMGTLENRSFLMTCLDFSHIHRKGSLVGVFCNLQLFVLSNHTGSMNKPIIATQLYLSCHWSPKRLSECLLKLTFWSKQYLSLVGLLLFGVLMFEKKRISNMRCTKIWYKINFLIWTAPT